MLLAGAFPPASTAAAAAPESSTARTRNHWAFKPPVRPPLPQVRSAQWPRTPVDHFILARLEHSGIDPSPEADRPTLIRRLSFDLTGLPPTPEEVDAFVNDARPSAYSDLVERLLASPHFGERFARHWLDLARYADSDGYEDDKFRPDAWRYREWAIDAYNNDIPFDRFTQLQIAGDLLPSAQFTELLPTGFHRMTLSNNAGAGGIQEEFRVKNVKDRANTVGSVWLGLTVGCAECHNHKYDPLSQKEYYQLYAFFNDIEEIGVPAPPVLPRDQHEYERVLQQFEDRIRQAREAFAHYEEKELPLRQQQWEDSARNALPETISSILKTPRELRSSVQQADLRKFYQSIDPEYARLKAALPVGDEVGNNRPPPPSQKALVIRELADQRRKAFIQEGGDFQRTGPEVEPATPAFLPTLETRKPRPDRLDLANWLIHPSNPLPARVEVNRIWQYLFGTGLVATGDNFGVRGEPASHPELLDWLAQEFVARKWSRKAIIRTIVLSATYRQSSRHRPELPQTDPGNILLARQNRFRLEAECVRDLALSASGLLNADIGGPSFQPPVPTALAAAKELKNERFMEPTLGPSRYRRGLYINVQRTFPFPMLSMFDAADANVCCTRRDRSNTPLQALTLLNDPVFFEAARALGLRLLRDQRSSLEAKLSLLFQLCLGREPLPDELAEMQSLQLELKRACELDPQAAVQLTAGLSIPSDVSVTEAATWIGLARTVMNLDEFITRE